MFFVDVAVSEEGPLLESLFGIGIGFCSELGVSSDPSVSGQRMRGVRTHFCRI